MGACLAAPRGDAPPTPPDSPAAWAADVLRGGPGAAAEWPAPAAAPRHSRPGPDGVTDSDVLVREWGRVRRWRWRRGGTRRLEACARPADPTPFSLSTLSSQHVDTLAGATFVNEYVVVGGLGRGAHGAVRAAVDTRRGALVALKVAPRVGRGDKAAALAAGGRDRGARGPVVGAAAREAALLRGLAAARCPGIVRLLELVDDPRRDRLLLIMEYCERGAVGSAAAPARASAAKAWRVAAGVAAALAGMHALGVAHGDVKPDNILERGDGSVVLADLGAARAAFPATAPTTTLAATLPARRAGGTPAFAPPEDCGGDGGGASGAAADVWALGVSLFHLARGAAPFAGASALELCDAIRAGVPREVAAGGGVVGGVEAGREFSSLVAACLTPSPAARPTAAALAPLFAAGAAAHLAAAPERAAPLAAALAAAPRRALPPGAPLATQGAPAVRAFYVMSGSLDVFYHMDGPADGEFDGDGSSDDDAERAVAAEAAAHPGARPRPPVSRLGRSPTVRETVTGASARAAALVARARLARGGRAAVAARGPGSLVAEPELLGGGADGSIPRWQTAVAAGAGGAVVAEIDPAPVRAAAAADARAADALAEAAAARRADLMMRAATERLAGLARELEGEVTASLGRACDRAAAAVARG